jgi:NAD+ kinase
MKIVLLGDGEREEIRRAAAEASSWLGNLADSLEVDLDGKLNLAKSKADLAVVFGGDGFLLSMARRLGDNPIPVLAVNFGKIGFIAEFAVTEARDAVEAFRKGRTVISERVVLDVCLEDTLGKERMRALNDVVLHRGANPRMLAVDISIDGDAVIPYAGDGLIVSTPTGSTAHAAAAGGAILIPGTDAIELTWICPQSMTTRPLVIPGNATVVLKPASPSPNATVTLDGQVTRHLDVDGKVTIHRAQTPFRIIRSPDRTYFDILRRKLHFGRLPRYRERFLRNPAEEDS